MNDRSWRALAPVVMLGVFAPARASAQDAYDFWREDPPPSATGGAASAEPPEVPHAPDPPAPPFGAAGGWSLDDATGAGLSSTTYGNSDASTFSFSSAVGLDYFVVRNVSLGLDLEASYGDDKGYFGDGSLVETKTTVFAGGPRLGIHIPLGSFVSIYPRLTVGIESIQQTTTRVEGSTAVSSYGAPALPSPLPASFGPRVAPWTHLFVPLLLHPASHFFVGIGPTLHRTFGEPAGGADVGLGERSAVGFSGILGGTWGGASEAASAAAAPSAPPSDGVRPRRFGDKGDFAIMGGLGLGGAWTSFDHTSSSSTSVSISPSFDYFAADHVSFGFQLDATSSSTSQSTGIASASDSTSTFGGAGRLGFDVPISPYASFFLVGDIGYGHTSYTRNDGAGNGTSYGATFLYVGFYAPVLVHVAQHFFLGAGPYASHDLSRTINSSQTSYPSTTLGVSFVVGGWL